MSKNGRGGRLEVKVPKDRFPIKKRGSLTLPRCSTGALQPRPRVKATLGYALCKFLNKKTCFLPPTRLSTKYKSKETTPVWKKDGKSPRKQQMMCSPKRSAAALKPKEGKPGLESGSGCRVPVPWAHGSQHRMREKHWVRGQPGSLITLPSFFSL